jgi:uncharacterized protein
MTNIEIVKMAYSCFATGDIPGVLTLFDPAIEWHECTGMPFVKDDGIYTGPDAVVSKVFMNLPLFYDGFNIAVTEIFGADDKVVMEGFYQGTNKATGNVFKANAAHLWTVRDGKLVRMVQAVDTVALNT